MMLCMPIVKNQIHILLCYIAFFYDILGSVLNCLSDTKLEQGISDFRLMDKKVIEALKRIHESDIFLRGMVKWIGFKQLGIPYTPSKRVAGKTTYSSRALLKLAVYGITSFSSKPLYFAIYLGFFFVCTSILYFPYVLYSFYVNAQSPGWASLLLTIVFFGSIQMILIGIVGIYLGKLFRQSKNRPTYIVRSTNL